MQTWHTTYLGLKDIPHNTGEWQGMPVMVLERMAGTV